MNRPTPLTARLCSHFPWLSFSSYAGEQICSAELGMDCNVGWCHSTPLGVFYKLSLFLGENPSFKSALEKEKNILSLSFSACHPQWMFLLLSQGPSGGAEWAATIPIAFVSPCAQIPQIAALCLSNINTGRILPLSFSWPWAIDQHSFSPKLWWWSFEFTSSAGRVWVSLYKPWQIAVLCQARVCVHLGS